MQIICNNPINFVVSELLRSTGVSYLLDASINSFGISKPRETIIQGVILVHNIPILELFSASVNNLKKDNSLVPSICTLWGV